MALCSVVISVPFRCCSLFQQRRFRLSCYSCSAAHILRCWMVTTIPQIHKPQQPQVLQKVNMHILHVLLALSAATSINAAALKQSSGSPLPALSLCTSPSLTNCQKVHIKRTQCINLPPTLNKKVRSMTVSANIQCQVFDYANCNIFDGNKPQGRASYVNVPGQQKNLRMFDMSKWQGKISSVKCYPVTKGSSPKWSYVPQRAGIPH